VTGAGPPKRPEQIRFVVLVAVDHPPVDKHDPSTHQAVGGHAVRAAQDPEPTTEREAGDPDRRT
jgi:hypothetical protein